MRSRDRLVLAYSPMVNYLASRKARELPAHCVLDDLISCGLIAILEAVDRFEPAKGATFEQYIWTRVAGSIVDELRRQDRGLALLALALPHDQDDAGEAGSPSTAGTRTRPSWPSS